MNTATRRQHDKFCRNEEWDVVRDARGKEVGHHVTYELPLQNGDILRTRISRPADNTQYGLSLWSRILREQLQVTDAEFWACVDNKTKPVRFPAEAAPSTPANAVPAWLVASLIGAGVPEAEVAQMDEPTAQARQAEIWSEPREA